jgi:hypothetical protein
MREEDKDKEGKEVEEEAKEAAEDGGKKDDVGERYG